MNDATLLEEGDIMRKGMKAIEKMRLCLDSVHTERKSAQEIKFCKSHDNIRQSELPA